MAAHIFTCWRPDASRPPAPCVRTMIAWFLRPLSAQPPLCSKETPSARRNSAVVEQHPEAMLLKVAHHGSASGTSADLLVHCQPRYAVISVGARNVYGHPRREVLDRLQAAGVITYRTDEEGAVSFYLDGKNVTPDTPLVH